MLEKIKNNLGKFFTYFLATLGALGIALQNYMAIIAIPNAISAAATVSNAVMGALHGVGVALGGLCGGLVNFFINIGLLESFLERVTGKKKRPNLKGFKWFSYWFGSAVFVCTGVLFGLTAVAFGPAGPLAALAIAAGVFVAVIMTIQELETWLQRFDDPETHVKKPIKQIFLEWKKSLTKGKVIGFLIAVGNVLALSLLFTMGLATVLSGVGLPALPALIVAFSIAFTAGAFTEFYFYHNFLSKFCDKFKEKWQAFKASKWPVVGVVCITTNAVVNTVLTYVGIIMITGLLIAAGVAAPPLGAMIAIAAVSALCAGIASFVLGMDFWTNNITKITNFFKRFKKSPPELTGEVENDFEQSTTILNKSLKDDSVQPELQKWDSSAVALERPPLKKATSMKFWQKVQPEVVAEDAFEGEQFVMKPTMRIAA